MTPLNSLASLEQELLATGYQRDTPGFELAVLRRKVELCQQHRAVAACRDCDHFDYCETGKTYLVQLRKQREVSAPVEVVVEGRLPDWMFPLSAKVHKPNNETYTESHNASPNGDSESRSR